MTQKLGFYYDSTDPDNIRIVAEYLGREVTLATCANEDIASIVMGSLRRAVTVEAAHSAYVAKSVRDAFIGGVDGCEALQ